MDWLSQAVPAEFQRNCDDMKIKCLHLGCVLKNRNAIPQQIDGVGCAFYASVSIFQLVEELESISCEAPDFQMIADPIARFNYMIKFNTDNFTVATYYEVKKTIFNSLIYFDGDLAAPLSERKSELNNSFPLVDQLIKVKKEIIDGLKEVILTDNPLSKNSMYLFILY